MCLVVCVRMRVRVRVRVRVFGCACACACACACVCVCACVCACVCVRVRVCVLRFTLLVPQHLATMLEKATYLGSRMYLCVFEFFCMYSLLKLPLLSGQFDDFSPQWYQYVGVSIMTLLFIHGCVLFLCVCLCAGSSC